MISNLFELEPEPSMCMSFSHKLFLTTKYCQGIRDGHKSFYFAIKFLLATISKAMQVDFVLLIQIACVNGLANEFDKFYKLPRPQTPASRPGSSCQFVFIMMATSRMFESSQVTSIHLKLFKVAKIIGVQNQERKK